MFLYFQLYSMLIMNMTCIYERMVSWNLVFCDFYAWFGGIFSHLYVEYFCTCTISHLSPIPFHQCSPQKFPSQAHNLYARCPIHRALVYCSCWALEIITSLIQKGISRILNFKYFIFKIEQYMWTVANKVQIIPIIYLYFKAF